jgi:hypothetical protein
MPPHRPSVHHEMNLDAPRNLQPQPHASDTAQAVQGGELSAATSSHSTLSIMAQPLPLKLNNLVSKLSASVTDRYCDREKQNPILLCTLRLLIFGPVNTSSRSAVVNGRAIELQACVIFIALVIFKGILIDGRFLNP